TQRGVEGRQEAERERHRRLSSMTSFWGNKLELKLGSRLDPKLFGKILAPPGPKGSIRLGQSLSEAGEVHLTPKDLSTHMHVLGGTGVGKSLFLQLLIKELILAGHGVCVIDPHGSLYRDMLNFCAYVARHKDGQKLDLGRRVIPFDISES